jgi:4-carboxymuconolactone decarboxylase
MKSIQQALKLSAFFVSLALAACQNKTNSKSMSEIENASLFQKGDKVPGDHFTGEVYLKPLLARDSNNNFVMGCVTFEAGARTNWHSHPKGQVLIIIDGTGINQEKGKPAQLIKKGDVINIPENVEHWHGATENSKLVHVAITNFKDDKNAVWLSPVTDDEYFQANDKF